MASAVNTKTEHFIAILKEPCMQFFMDRNPEVVVHEKVGRWAQLQNIEDLCDNNAVSNSIDGFWTGT